MSTTLTARESKLTKKRAKPYSPEFREEVLRLAATGDVTDAEIEQDLGPSPQLILQWRQRYGIPSGEPATPSGSTTLSEAEAEIRQCSAIACPV